MVSDLTSWTLKISQQQEENDKLQREENERLEADIALARKAREARKSGFRSPGKSYTSKFQPPPTSSLSIPSLPSSSTPRTNGPSAINNTVLPSSSSARHALPPPSSLATMMGSSEQGPRLTRAPAGGDGRIGSSIQAAAGVGLPGLAGGRGGARTGGGGAQQEQEVEQAPSRWKSPAAAASSSTAGESTSKPFSPVKPVGGGYQQKLNSTSTLPFERASASTKVNVPSSTSTSTPASASTPRPFAFTSQRSSTVPVPASTFSSSSQQQHRSKPSYGNSSTSPTTTPSASLLLRPIPTPTPAPPVLSGSTAAPSQAFTRPSSSERGPTASLTRLKGRGIVEEQLRKSRLREEGEEGGLAGISEFGSPALGGGEWDGNRSGGKASSSPKLMSSNGSGGFPRSLQRSPSLSSTPSTTTYTSTSTATAQLFLPPTSSATDAFPVLRPTRRHQTSASISQIPSQPPPPLSTTASRHRPTASVGKLPTINSLAKEEHQQQPLRVRTTGKLFASKQTQEPTTSSSSSPIIPQIPGSPRVSVRNFVKSVETASPVVVEPPTGRRQFGGGGPAVAFPSTSSTPVSQSTRSSTTPHPPPKAFRAPSPTSTISHRVQPPPRRTTTRVTSSTSDSHHSHSHSHTSPPLSNPYSAFFVPSSSSSSNAPTTTAIVVPRPPSPIKPPTNQGIGLPGLALSPELSSSRRYLEHVEQASESKPLERKHVRGVGLPGMVATAVEKKEEVVPAPPSPTKSKVDFERPSSPIKKGFFQPQTTMVAPARPGSPSKLDARPASPSKVAFPSVVDASPSSPTKRGFNLTPSTNKSVEQPETSSVKPSNGGGVAVGVLKSSATPVRVRKESRGSSSGVDQVEAAAAASRGGEERLPSSPGGSGGLFHPTRDRARKPKPKTNRTSLTSSPSNKPLLAATKPVVLVEPVPPVPAPTTSSLARQRPVSSTKPSSSSNASPPPSPTKLTFQPTDTSLPPPSPTKREFQSGNVAQRRSVWGDQAPIGVARPLSSYGGQETVGEKELGGEMKKEDGEEKKVGKGPKGTFGGKALPGMVFVEKKEEEVKKVEEGKEVKEVKKIVVVEKKKEERPTSTKTKTRVVDPPLPKISISTLLASSKPTEPNSPPSLTLSLEILSISSSGQTTPLPTGTPNSPWIFYTSEMLAVVHRSKSRETGLVSSKVWGWKGRRVDSNGGGKAESKLEEIAKRLSVGVIEVKQGEEDQELMAVLGNKLVIRQGERDHFSSENTSLYTVQQLQGSILIDEIDLLPSSLTSRHSLVLTVLSQVFLYHGQGSLRPERIAGRQYAALLAKDCPAEFIELEESAVTKSEDHELFWMCFGEEEEGEGSRAWHWKFRSGLEEDEGRGWSVESGKVTPMNSLLAGDVFGSGIKLVLVSFEIFVVVAQNARARRQDIRLALHLAERISRSIQTSRPFKPPVHALILPSKIPSDLKTYFRYLDEDEINGGHTPSHMNVRSLDEAREHLAQVSWSSSMLRDETFLPLGVAPRSG